MNEYGESLWRMIRTGKRDYSAGWRAAENGMSLAYNARKVSDEWKFSALECVRVCAAEKETFIIDDVHVVMTRRGVSIETPTHGCALGAVMRIAAKDGYIESTKETRRSKRVSTHADVRPVWRSKIWEGK
jgi:hypothetical protein